ncbi:glycosyl hydrolase [Umezawaea sp. Da 62-37]|uniref:glycosyl hydrolase n=1 Tax=Umezawaea sp. Da 62-37 TaxID=3075927 RepID=UPI0028F73257|nr:glycosyl hydrolase [Umezawaea sp. Da 62-37]WNV86868.1 glycosyl hydrolase [Umezawaea sp. Da 62-37]
MRHARKRWAAALALLLASTAGTASADVHTTATASDLVGYLAGISGRNTLSGQQDGPSSAPSTWQNKVHDITGEYPGVWGGDFAFEQNDINARATVIAQAKSVWAAGSIPALVWHSCPPTVATTCHWDWGDGAIRSTLSEPQWNELVTDGSGLNQRWKQRLDEAVPYLQDLKNNGIPVLWRPIHEMNEGWSWWGGRPGANGSRKLYQITHDYLTNVKGLDNLVWVWNVKDIAGGASHLADYWPGSSYVDVAALDAWSNQQPTTEYYNAMVSTSGGKPIALAEVGTVPTPQTLAAQPKWTYFSVWINWLTDPAWNNNDAVKRTYYDGRVLNRGEVHLPGAPTTRAGQISGSGKCVDVTASNTTNGTPVQLYTCDGGTAQRWTIGTDGTLRALGKCLDVASAGTANGTAVQLWDCNGTNAQKWTTTSTTLVNTGSGRCLDAVGKGTANGTRLQIWDCTGNTNQAWTLP